MRHYGKLAFNPMVELWAMDGVVSASELPHPKGEEAKVLIPQIPVHPEQSASSMGLKDSGLLWA